MQGVDNSQKQEDAHWAPPTIFDGYRKLSLIGKGGMGRVYLCHDAVLDRPVAIKFISGIEPDRVVREQFLNEARAAARLQHPHVVAVYRVGEIDAHPYIVSEYIRGENLARLKKPLPWQDVLDLGVGLARGLAAAHRRGILHRDIKPSNAILSLDGEVKLVDFGISKLVPASTVPGYQEGTPIPEDSNESEEETDKEDAPTVDVPGTPSSGISAADVATTKVEEPDLTQSGAQYQAISNSRNLAVRLGLSSPTKPGLNNSDMSQMQGSSENPSSIRGTPHYIAPEIFNGEPATRRSDVYSMGVVLYEIVTGSVPHQRVPIEALAAVITSTDAPPVRTRQPIIDERFAQLIDRCLRRNASERFASAEDLLEALERLTPGNASVAIPEGNPYRGLLPFEAEHRALFFGRQQEVGMLLDWLRSDSFVLIVADSGAGKSSLCRAGVLPLVSEGALGGNRRWLTLSIVPGRHPLHSFCAALAQALHHVDFSEDRIAQQIHSDPSAFGRTLQNHLGTERGLILFVDQLEELVSIADPTQAALSSEMLASLVQRLPGLRLLATVRSDFLARCASLPGLGGELTRPLFFLKPLAEEGIREAIVGPARVKGVSFQREEMVEHLIQFTRRTDGALPLLQFALAELWAVRQETEITPRALEAIGGVEGALARHGDNLLGTLQGDQRKSARRILMALVTLEGTRNRRTLDELILQDPAAPPALEALVKGRLIVGRESPDGALYEVAHEALIKGWRTLAKWLEEAAESRAVQHRLEVASNDWLRQHKSRDALWNLRQIAEANLLETAAIGPREQEFLNSSRRYALRARRIRRIVIVTAPLLVIAIFIGARLNARRDIVLRTQAAITAGQATLQSAEAFDAAAVRLREAAFAAFDNGKNQDGEKIWSQVLKADRNTDGAYTQAAQSFETALSLDSAHPLAKALLAKTLYRRALLLERSLKKNQAEELLSRINLYDKSGHYLEKWRAPGKYQISSKPSNAQVKLSKFILNEKDKYDIVPQGTIGVTPLGNVALEQGAYLLEFDLPDHVHVKYPILANRAEQIAVQVDLPRSQDIPPGFSYIPSGAYISGSTADEDFRQGTLKSMPAHRAIISSYLISKYETTNYQWLEYIKTLSAIERTKSKNQISRSDRPGDAFVKLDNKQWQITLSIEFEPRNYKEGEPVIYKSRTNRKYQDWYKLPISCAALENGQAYADWLDRTNRLPGATVCNEYQWQRAARGADGRAYPHGERVDPGEANYNLTYDYNNSLMGIDEVGSYPASASVFDVFDLPGNVAEITTLGHDKHRAYYRGGRNAESAFPMRTDYLGEPITEDLSIPGVGFRICAPYPLPRSYSIPTTSQ